MFDRKQDANIHVVGKCKINLNKLYEDSLPFLNNFKNFVKTTIHSEIHSQTSTPKCVSFKLLLRAGPFVYLKLHTVDKNCMFDIPI